METRDGDFVRIASRSTCGLREDRVLISRGRSNGSRPEKPDGFVLRRDEPLSDERSRRKRGTQVGRPGDMEQHGTTRDREQGAVGRP